MLSNNNHNGYLQDAYSLAKSKAQCTVQNEKHTYNNICISTYNRHDQKVFGHTTVEPSTNLGIILKLDLLIELYLKGRTK